mgnify:CR=1 FL=1
MERGESSLTVSEIENLSSVEIELPDEKLEFSTGYLWSPLAIPAYKVLSKANMHLAKDVLVCLHSYQGYKNRMVYPSYTSICKRTGRSRSSVSKGLRQLIDFGFVKKFQWYEGKRKRNRYYLQDSCWSQSYMGDLAKKYLEEVGTCGCGEAVKEGELGFGRTSYHHYGCGDVVRINLDATYYKRKEIAARKNALLKNRDEHKSNGLQRR